MRAAPWCLACSVWFWGASAWAQSAPSPPAPTAADDVGATLVTDHGRRIWVAHRDIVVPGERQRPYAFDVAGRSPIGYVYLDARVHLVDEIVASTRRAPFRE